MVAKSLSCNDGSCLYKIFLSKAKFIFVNMLTRTSEILLLQAVGIRLESGFGTENHC